MGLGMGPSPNTVPNVHSAKHSGVCVQAGLDFTGEKAMEETMDVPSPAQEEETSSLQGSQGEG